MAYLEEVLNRKFVKVGNCQYHMPRYYADNIYKKKRTLCLDGSSKAKTLVQTPLSVALENRTFLLRCSDFDKQLTENGFNGSSAFRSAAMAQDVTLLDRNSKAKQSIFRVYQRSRF